MKCAVPTCEGTLRVSHTFTIESEKFQRAVCSKCGTVHALETQATVVTARGDGAKARAARARELACDDSISPSS